MEKEIHYKSIEQSVINYNKLKSNLEIIENTFEDELWLINNKALVVSLVLFVCKLVDRGKSEDKQSFYEFFVKLNKTLRWQIPLGDEMEESYKYLTLDFQTYVTQAADKTMLLKEEKRFWKKNLTTSVSMKI